MPTCRICHEYYYSYESSSEILCEVCIGEGWAEEEFLEEEKTTYCESSGCYQKAKKSEKYCSDCQLENEKVHCKNPPCHEKISKDEKLCWNCKNDKDAVRLASCSFCYVNYHHGDEFIKCRQHGNSCLSCNDRIPEYMNYCSEHSSSCLICSTIISVNQTYCSFHQEHQEQENLKSLVQQKTSLSNPQEVIRFNTWWNNNLATVINGNSYYTLWLLVYEPAERSRSEILRKFEISQGYDKYSLASVKNKANSLRSELNGNNPILAIVGFHGSFSISDLLSEPYVLRKEIHRVEIDKTKWCECYPVCPANDMYDPGICPRAKAKRFIYPHNPGDYLRPLDVVWIEKDFGTKYFHVGIYLGKEKVYHIVGTPFDKKGVRITDWNDFIKGGIGKLILYHPVIPFKNYELIARQIAWAENTWWREGEYCLAGQNCEHAANMVVYGIEYSQQVAERSSLAEFFSRKYPANKNKGSSLVLENEMNRVNNELLGERDDQRTRDIRDQYKAQIEVSARNNCSLM